MTNGWTDIRNADVILAMGGNPAENHPVGFRFVMEAKRERNARLVSVDPRFNRTAAVADSFTQIRAGSDIAFLAGLMNYALTHDRYHAEYIRLYTNATFLVKEGYSFNEQEGVFSGWDEQKGSYDKSTWNYELDEKGFAKVDPTMEHPRSVFQLMKSFYSRYTPETVSIVCGCKPEDFVKAAEIVTSTYTPDRVGTIMYALGWTQHSVGSQMIRTAAMVQLLLGNIGMAGGGMNALRGHSNIQGLTDLGLLSNLLPGYMTLPGEKEADYAAYIKTRTLKPLRPGQLSYWQNYSKFHVSLMKAWYGDAAHAGNNWAFEYLPKLDKVHDVLQVFEDMHQGKMNGYICQGFNPVGSFPCKAKVDGALQKLKFLVTIDPLVTETSRIAASSSSSGRDRSKCRVAGCMAAIYASRC